ncbi:MAG TPA: transcriptional regulator [Oscillibacter sp.]|nr:transcriptional regulator [Oscillibacter sp.]
MVQDKANGTIRDLRISPVKSATLSLSYYVATLLAIKKAREKKGMTQEQLADIIGRDTRTVMYHENDGQHPSLDIFYQLATMFDLSVDEYFYPDMSADEAAKKRINIQLNSLNESELRLVEGIINAIIENRGTEEA